MLLQNSGLEPVSQNSHKITHNSGVCPRTYPQDQMRIKGNQTVAPVFQNEVLRTTDVLRPKLNIKQEKDTTVLKTEH